MSLDLSEIKAELAALTFGQWESLSAFILLADGGGDWATASDESFILKAPERTAELIAEIEDLQDQLKKLQRASGWDRYFEAKAQPLREALVVAEVKAELWDELQDQVTLAYAEYEADPAGYDVGAGVKKAMLMLLQPLRESDEEVQR